MGRRGISRWRSSAMRMIGRCWRSARGEPGETDFWYLHFYELGEGGKLQEANRKLLPLGNEPRRKFELPRKGRTIVVRDTRSQKVLSRWTWDGGKFVREK